MLLLISRSVGSAYAAKRRDIGKVKSLEQEMTEAYRAGNSMRLFQSARRSLGLTPQPPNTRFHGQLAGRNSERKRRLGQPWKGRGIGYTHPDTLASENNIASLNYGKRLAEIMRKDANQAKPRRRVRKRARRSRESRLSKRFRRRLPYDSHERKSTNQNPAGCHLAASQRRIDERTIEAMSPLFVKHTWH